VPLDPARLAAALLHDCHTRLAVYGSLQPGEQHHDLVEDLPVVARGALAGRVTDLDGYPVLRLDPAADRVDVVVLAGAALSDRWEELDRFEGPAYRRDLVIVEVDERGGVLVASCYVASGA